MARTGIFLLNTNLQSLQQGAGQLENYTISDTHPAYHCAVMKIYFSFSNCTFLMSFSLFNIESIRLTGMPIFILQNN